MNPRSRRPDTPAELKKGGSFRFNGWHCVTHRFPPIDPVRAKKETVFGQGVMEEERNRPQMVGQVVNADRDRGLLCTHDLHSAHQGVPFSPFDIKFQEGDSTARKQRVQPTTGDPRSARGSDG